MLFEQHFFIIILFYFALEVKDDFCIRRFLRGNQTFLEDCRIPLLSYSCKMRALDICVMLNVHSRKRARYLD